MAKAVLESDQQLQWSIWFRDGDKNIEYWSKVRGMEISKIQIPGEGNYAIVERQSVYDSHTASLNAGDIIKVIRKKIDSLTFRFLPQYLISEFLLINNN